VLLKKVARAGSKAATSLAQQWCCRHCAAAAGVRRGRTSTWQCQICSSGDSSSDSTHTSRQSASVCVQTVTHSCAAPKARARLAFTLSFLPSPSIEGATCPP
jgi:hypothetical protein